MTVAAVLPDLDLDALTERALGWCDRLSAHTEAPGTVTRTFLSEPIRELHRELADALRAAGLQVRVDAAGNLRGHLPGQLVGRTEGAPTLYVGSHLDTVPNGGKYDGLLGVTAWAALLAAVGPGRLNFHVELLGFSEEEGVRFRVPFIGSRAVAGTLDDALLATRDAEGVSVTDAIRAFGLNPAQLGACAAPPGALGFVELHIEQGPQLEAQDRPVAVVDAVAGQSRAEVTFHGHANHAGTTPMNLRHDALTGAARFVLDVEAHARATPGLVATVGRIDARPGAGNVVPGEVTVSLDVRHARDGVREAAVTHLLGRADQIAGERGLRADSRVLMEQPAVPMDAALTNALRRAAGDGAPVLTSGAGHDAMIMAARMPAAMLFLRSPGGVSHHPDEAVLEPDVREALRVLAALLAELHAQREAARG